jgi:ankyrin repeat protein
MSELMNAVLRNDVEEVRRLSKVCCTNFIDEDGNTPIMVAVMHGYTRIVRILASNPYTDIEFRNEASCTPLMAALVKRRMRCARILLQHGADPDARNHFGTPLSMYVASKGLTSFMKLLIEYGVDVNAHDNHHYTPLMIGIFQDRMSLVKTLLRHPDINIHTQALDGATIFSLPRSDRMMALIDTLRPVSE